MSYWLTFDLLSVNFHIIYLFRGKLEMFLHYAGLAGGGGRWIIAFSFLLFRPCIGTKKNNVFKQVKEGRMSDLNLSGPY